MDESPASARRLPVVDVARGLALLAMVVYHLSWDLAYVHLVAWDVAGDPLWRGFARAIAGSFLLLSGLSLALSVRGGFDGGRQALRIGKIALAAAAVSLATWIAFPDSFVFFGILHMIAVGSVLVLPLLRAPAVVSMALAVAALLLPRLLPPIDLDSPLLWPLGLGAAAPPANDYVPVFPWIAPMLAGVALGRLVADGRLGLPSVEARRGPARALAVAGRWSLVVYLVHQPLLFGLAMGLAAILPPVPSVERAWFVRDCEAGCGGWSADGPYCARFCGCVADSLAGTAFWTVRGGDPGFSSVVAAAAGTCRGGEGFDPSAPVE
jgi:uncharacterized membrane protein